MKIKLMKDFCCVEGNKNMDHCPLLTFCEDSGEEVEDLSTIYGFYFKRGDNCRKKGDFLVTEIKKN